MSILQARLSAAQLARRISAHHQGCAVCQRGGRIVMGRGGAAREPCRVEAALFGLLAQATDEGWPS